MSKTFEYAPAPESRDIARLKPSYQIFVNGEFRDGTSEPVTIASPGDLYGSQQLLDHLIRREPFQIGFGLQQDAVPQNR